MCIVCHINAAIIPMHPSMTKEYCESCWEQKYHCKTCNKSCPSSQNSYCDDCDSTRPKCAKCGKQHAAFPRMNPHFCAACFGVNMQCTTCKQHKEYNDGKEECSTCLNKCKCGLIAKYPFAKPKRCKVCFEKKYCEKYTTDVGFEKNTFVVGDFITKNILLSLF